MVLAGGQSRRFGSDKAFADVGGIPLIDRATYFLQSCCSQMVIVGREMGPAQCIPDWPEAHRGPLGGVAGAFKYAISEGYRSILTIPVDAVDLPKNLPELLGEAPSAVANAPTIAHWPVGAFDTVRAILESDGKHSLRALAEAIGAREVVLPDPVRNINTPGDVQRLLRQLK